MPTADPKRCGQPDDQNQNITAGCRLARRVRDERQPVAVSTIQSSTAMIGPATNRIRMAEMEMFPRATPGTRVRPPTSSAHPSPAQGDSSSRFHGGRSFLDPCTHRHHRLERRSLRRLVDPTERRVWQCSRALKPERSFGKRRVDQVRLTTRDPHSAAQARCHAAMACCSASWADAMTSLVDMADEPFTFALLITTMKQRRRAGAPQS